MNTAEKLEKMFDIDAQRIAEIDKDACQDILQGSPVSTVTGPGRPPLFGKAMQQISFKESADRVQAIDKRAEELGIKRSDYLRQLVENDLQCSGMI